MPTPCLPPDIRIFERGWLSSNNILICGRDACALIDSGYVSHAPQTLALVQAALQGRTLDVLVSTHLHSDHCGGNAALQSAYPALVTHIPPGQAGHVESWDPQALTYTPTGQSCPQFRFDALLAPGSELRLGDELWQVHAAPGHDPHSVILFEPTSRTLISADALWQRGFGVVFPELEGLDAFEAVGQTIDLIESLAPKLVIPGHGSAFEGVTQAIAVARARLDSFVSQPAKHISYAAKVLLKFKLLEVQAIALEELITWASATPYFSMIFEQHFPQQDFRQWIEQLIGDLIRSGAASRAGLMLRNAG
ncbi:MAG: MBL fold metallo-hydrolase [Gammaproteobacteria bacterium]|uniref:MBL fold metallo-hydrolase n=1 Tax=Rhodoferax sp. TaxID=50421 RepID=UPI0017F487D6|nr:MBL fold metallo-hydrolase [Rhodoferax sp.]MBU3898521.1 MBL fold metallo-hydrolase [Gammaproteobacteria bacterium]MBA3056823.1 MBL fold metallo-hydrolase [Rhodoferax sp.]MBU3997848.1 MBL fold metallo-hydrolase [Gammaproteobacteria bacterium]MBU4079296.1 MBL fold metallo-hydrolase [Gammaproteobacteria bacterium]MBU4113242.1 MBL fold metallo-hydrolase [Gammaproteobacteria bacterium]